MSDNPDRRATLLVYASDERVRERVRTALGVTPEAGLRLDYVEVATGAEVVARCDEGGVDIAILDGEATPTGGIGLCRQLKAELDDPPPVLLLLGRRDDAWLATWSRAEGVALHPIDSLALTDEILRMLAPQKTVVVAD